MSYRRHRHNIQPRKAQLGQETLTALMLSVLPLWLLSADITYSTSVTWPKSTSYRLFN